MSARMVTTAAFCAAALALGAGEARAGSAVLTLTPWTSVYGIARDERTVAQIARDKKIVTEVKAALLRRDGKLGLAVKVYCFVGRVTLLGQLADEPFKRLAMATARRVSGVRSVGAHWEAPGKTDTTARDLAIAAKIRAALIADKGVSATQIETEVFGGRVYLLGMVRSHADARRAVADARGVAGVRDVVSLLTSPRR